MTGVWVEAEEDLSVAERVLLLYGRSLGDGVTLGLLDDGLHFRAVDQAGDVGVADEVGLGRREDGVQSREGRGGPDDEAAQVTTWGELEEVQGSDGRGLDTGDVAESANQLTAVGLGVVDDQGTAALAVAAVSQLTLSCAQFAGLLDLDDIWAGTDSLQQSDGSGGLDESGALDSLAGDDERNLGDGGDAVATGEEESWDGAGSDGGSSSESPATCVSIRRKIGVCVRLSIILLTQVNLLMPLSPDLGWREHTTRAALVTKGSLTGSVSTTTRDTRNTGDSATWFGCQICLLFLFSISSCNPKRTCTPGLGRGLFTGLFAHGIWLSLILGHSGVDESIHLSARRPWLVGVVDFSYWTISGRIGELKTAGRG